MAIERKEILEIANKTAERIVKSYLNPASVELGLANSIGEEQAAAEYYVRRSDQASKEGDYETSRLYLRIASEESDHAMEYLARGLELAGEVNPAERRKRDLSGYESHNPPTTIVENGITWHIHMSFITRKEAEEEAMGMQSAESRFKVFPWDYGYAVYEHPLNEPATFIIEAQDIGHRALVFGKYGSIIGVYPKAEFYDLKMDDGTVKKREPKVNVTVLADMQAKPEKIWIRRDRQDGKIEEVTEKWVRDHIGDVYIDIDMALHGSSEKNPLTTGFADYWPKT